MGRYKFKQRKFPKDFQKVVDYIKEKKGIHVSLGTETEFLGYFNRQIIIHHNYDLRNNGLYVLLHEVAGVLNPMPEFLPHTDASPSSKINRFLHESSLWIRGEEIAKELGIKINKHEYDDLKIKLLTEFYENN